MDRPPNIWFIAAWLLLVVVVAFGFYVQARTIEELRNTQEIQEELIRFICSRVECS